MSTRNHSKGTRMATTQSPTTDAPTLPTNTYAWPAFDREHDPVYLHTNDPAETETRTLADFGGRVPEEPTRPSFPIDSRDQTEQMSVFAFPRTWWHDADRLAQLFDERDLSIVEISALFGDDVGYEVVRSNLQDYEIRTPERDGAMATQLANPDFGPEDIGLSPSQTDDSHSKFTKRGERA